MSDKNIEISRRGFGTFFLGGFTALAGAATYYRYKKIFNEASYSETIPSSVLSHEQFIEQSIAQLKMSPYGLNLFNQFLNKNLRIFKY